MEDCFIPKLETIKDEGSKLTQELYNFTEFLQLELKARVLHTYIREATQPYNTRVYRMKIW